MVVQVIRLGVMAAVLSALLCAPARATLRIDGFPEAAPAYAAFLSALPHGDELDSLKVTIAPPADVPRLCGNAGMTACYVVEKERIIVPGPDLPAELLAHEYGHHLAAHRPGGPAGPANWASFQHVCVGMRGGKLGHRWVEDPAEAWADVYARLTFPDLAWRLSPLLRPSEEAYAAAIRDVAAPSIPRIREFRGRFGEFGSGRRRFTLPLRLDGTMEVRLQAADDLELDLRIISAGRRIAFTPARLLRFDACRTHDVERLVLEVRRRSGTGAFSVGARYPG